MRASYYEEELDYIRRLAQEFGAAHPEASHLVAPGQDPDVERLLEGFAYLAAQVRATLDDDFPELTHGLFAMLWPNALRPVPSFAIEEFTPTPGAVRQTVQVPAGAEVCADGENDMRFRYRTTWPVALQPVAVESASLERLRGGQACVTVQLALHTGAAFDKLDADRIRLYLNGDVLQVRQLHHLLLRHVASASASGDVDGHAATLRVSPVGFDDEGAVLPYPPGSPPGYRLLQEYFVFPEKFMFVDVSGLAGLRGNHVKSRITLRFELDREPDGVLRITRESFAVNCAPVVNLFPHGADPVTIDGTRTRYVLRPQGRDSTQLDAVEVDGMTLRASDRSEREIPHFYGFGADVFRGATSYFTTRREPSPDGRSHQMYVTLVGVDGSPQALEGGVGMFDLTCTNGQNVAALGPRQLVRASDSSPAVTTFRNLTKPTRQIEPPRRVGTLWRLLSHLSLNRMSFASADTLRAVLEMLSFAQPGTAGDPAAGGGQDRAASEKIAARIRAIRAVRSEPVERLFGGGLVRGSRVHLDADLGPFGVAGELFLFGCVLDEFLAAHATINTFTQLALHHDQGRESLAWPARLGRDRL